MTREEATRDILFRGRRVDNGDWIYGSLISFPKGKPFIVSEETLLRSNYCDIDIVSCAEEIIPETRGQYTGLTDKNDVKIFEGDVVKTLETDEEGCLRSFPVVCKKGAFWLYDKYLLNNEHLDFLASYSETALEVVGNIFDNPELLEGGSGE